MTATLSALFHALAHHPLALLLGLVAAAAIVGFLIQRRTGSRAGYALVVVSFVAGMLNIFTGQWLNAAFLEAAGIRGQAIIVASRATTWQLNNAPVREYDALVTAADGKEVVATFTSMSASIWPIRNAILIPPEGEEFVVKYVPGFERNIAIMSDESDYGRRRFAAEAAAVVERARRLHEASPGNPQFLADYRRELLHYIDESRGAADDPRIAAYEQALRKLDSDDTGH
jgi:hypothetical protein